MGYARPSPEDLATLKIPIVCATWNAVQCFALSSVSKAARLKIPNSIPGKPRNSLNRGPGEENSMKPRERKGSKKFHTPAASSKIPNSLAPQPKNS